MGEKLLTTDLSDAHKNKVWIQISVSFCTISSSLSCLLGSAMSIADWAWGFGFSYCLIILAEISLSVQFWRSTSHLFSRFCTQKTYPGAALRTFLSWRMISGASLSLRRSQLVWIFHEKIVALFFSKKHKSLTLSIENQT